MVRIALAALLLATAFACQPSWSLHGQAVLQRAAAGSDELLQEPAAFAHVTLRCPDERSGLLAVRADAEGTFTFSGTGLGPSVSCEVVVEAPGHEPAIARVDEGCTDTDDSGARCVAGALLAELKE
jgi:hypothetical protein